MRYLRHFPLTLWVAVAALLAGLIAIGLMNGSSTPLPPYVAAGSLSERPAAMAALQRVSGVYPALASGNVASWATETASEFDLALKAHEAAVGTEDDQLGIAWYNAKVAALNLAASPPEQRHERAAALGQAVQYVAAVVDGVTLAPATKAEPYLPPVTPIGKAVMIAGEQEKETE